MHFNPNEIYHVYNRGNNKQTIFFQERNYLYFLEKAEAYLKPDCDILGWCLMPNHFHFLIHANEESCKPAREKPILISNLVEAFRLIVSSYSKAIQVQEDRSGNLFQKKTKSKSVYEGTRDYSLTAFHYIHQNPLKAGLVKRLEDWEYSSFKDYAGLRNGTLCNKDLAKKKLDLNYETFVADSYAVLNEDLIAKIW